MGCEDFENFNCPTYWRETAEGTGCVALFRYKLSKLRYAAGVCEAPSWYKGGCPHIMLVGADSRFRQDTPQNCPGHRAKAGRKIIVPMSERIFSVWSFKNICQKKSACRLLELKVATFNRACGDDLSCRFQIQLHGSDFAKQIF